jgi:hypothetical protein
MKLDDKKFPKDWKKTAEEIISREDLLSRFLNPLYLKASEARSLFDLIENFDPDFNIMELSQHEEYHQQDPDFRKSAQQMDAGSGDSEEQSE